MAIKIELGEKKIPIEIGDYTFYFEKSNDNIFKVEQSGNNARKIHELLKKKESLSGAFKDVDKFVKEEFNELFEDDVYNKVKELSSNSIELSWIYAQVIFGILEELESTGDVKNMQQKAQKYLKK